MRRTSGGRLHLFQSTLPARGATLPAPFAALGRAISIHAPRTGSDYGAGSGGAAGTISIHAPRTGSDNLAYTSNPERRKFQSTLPARGATCCCWTWNPARTISIHAPRTGSDERPQPADAHGSHFNPRSPHGERRTLYLLPNNICGFQSTLPARGATRQRVTPPNAKGISIHAPRTGSDNPTQLQGLYKGNFNPRSPHGERLPVSGMVLTYPQFQSTLPARGATVSQR